MALFAWHLDQIAQVIGGDAFLLQFWAPRKSLSLSHISASFLIPTVSTAIELTFARPALCA
jgi:hypothetical protein